MNRVLSVLVVLSCFFLACAPQQSSTGIGKGSPGQSAGSNTANISPEEESTQVQKTLEKFEEFFGLVPPTPSEEIAQQFVASQGTRENAGVPYIPPLTEVTPKSFQIIETSSQPTSATDRFQQSPPPPKEEVGLNFEQADIHDVIKVISEITGKSFVVDKDVAGEVTIYSEETLTPDQVFDLFKSVLELNGLAITQVGAFYKIVTSETAQQRYLRVDSVSFPEEEDRLVTQIVKLKYVGAKEVKGALKGLTPAEIIIYPGPEDGDTLIITDLASNVRKLLEIIKQMDISQYANHYIEVFPIEHATLNDLIADLYQILSVPGSAGPLDQMITQPQPELPAPFDLLTEPGQPAEVQEPVEPVEPVSPIVPQGTQTSLYPITRLNALMVSTNNPDVLTVVRKWIQILDQPSFKEAPPSEAGLVEEEADIPTTYVYFVKYAKADELAPKLTEIYAKGAQPSQPDQPDQQQPDQQQPDQQQPDRQQPDRQQPFQPPTENQEPEPIFITDPATNSIIIKATPTQYAQINQLLEKLDRRPLQVLIDVIIAEVSLSDSDVFGVKGMLNSQGQLTIGGETNAVNATAETNFPGTDTGFSYAIAAPGRFYLKLQALATESRVKVLASPNILVRNNNEAKINIGDSIPLKKTRKENEEEIVEWEYKETGIILTVTPQINLEGDVVLKIDQEVSTPGPATGDQAPPINKTNASTSLVTYDGQPLVIGGLIRTRDIKSVQGVPLLKDIPLLGRLFRFNELQSERKELLLLVMPRIIKTPEQGWNLSDDVLTKQIRRLEQLFNREETDTEKIKRFLKNF